MGVFSNLHKTRNTGSKRSSSKSSRSSSKSRGVQKVSYYEGNDVVRSYEKGGIRYGVKKDGSLVRVAPSKKVVVGFTRDSKTGKVVDTLKDANEPNSRLFLLRNEYRLSRNFLQHRFLHNKKPFERLLI